jgi:hypothetical protein
MNAWWKDNKQERKDIQNKINLLKFKTSSKVNPIFYAFSKNTKASSRNDSALIDSSLENESAPAIESAPSPEPEVLEISDQNEREPPKQLKRAAPAQEKAMDELNQYQKELLALLQAKNSGILLSEDQRMRVKTLQKSTKESATKIKRLKTGQKSSKKRREKKEIALRRLQEEHPDAARELNTLIAQPTGRPRLEREQTDLLDAIISIVTCHSSADEKRRSETLRTIKTLDQLLTEMKLLGKF